MNLDSKSLANCNFALGEVLTYIRQETFYGKKHMDLNKAYAYELYIRYLDNPASVGPKWREFFRNYNDEKDDLDEKLNEFTERESLSSSTKSGGIPDGRSRLISDLYDVSNVFVDEMAEIEELSPIRAKLAENMEVSLEIPTASSARDIPVKSLDENRRIINKYLIKMKRPRVSFTHVLAWALTRALLKFPHMNNAFAVKDGKPSLVKRKAINVGLAVDIKRKDGKRLLLVPNVKNCEKLNFSEFILKFEEMIQKTRNDAIDLDDLVGTTVTLTNPGMIGTASSYPRLQRGQGLILATGSIGYPTEFQAMRPDVLAGLAVSKTVTLTSTYDHRIIQGAESAEFLEYLQKLLVGRDNFYDQIFYSLKIPFEPIKWELDEPARKSQNPFDQSDMIEKNAHVMQMINAYRVRGHLLASINPLGHESHYYPELDPAYYGFTIWDLERRFHVDDNWRENNLSLRDTIELLRETYCGPIGYEFMHIQSPVKKDWIKKKLEAKKGEFDLTKKDKFKLYKNLMKAEIFENYLHKKFVGHKRFSLEGGESTIIFLEKVFELAADEELFNVVLGMAHRGRLNVLANIFQKPYETIFAEFEGQIDAFSYQGSGDVKYHLGEKGTYRSDSGKEIKATLAPNPSHLELVNPVVEGMTRALDNKYGDGSYVKSLPILVHGDAAFAGQGIVAETLNFSQLDGYKTGGTIHVVVNNQIGFTTGAHEARSSIYATDISKMIQAPILHVNGNDPEAVFYAAVFAYEYRNRFESDVIVDILCYRKYGHNEADEPSYTQPLLYKKIHSMTPVGELYRELLVKEGALTKEQAGEFDQEFTATLDKAFADRNKNEKFKNKSKKVEVVYRDSETKVPADTLRKITDAITSYPDDFNANKKIVSLLEKRKQMVESDKPKIDWAMAEALAFGSILLDGKEIRFSGEDSGRGTFSQRHAVLVDFLHESEYVPLNNIEKNQSLLRIYDSPLSELAILGFEYGYSVVANEGLTLWEAQFGDFANMAQPIFDQFISCGEAKWGQRSNLVCLLPHSYDGQGPEHSSARLERYLQLGAGENIIVCNLSTPAQYFHVLRRQTNGEFLKPLIIMTPKSMLRHPRAVSSSADLSEGKFMEIIDDATVDAKKVKRVILCTGKVYWDLLAEKENSDASDVAIVRVEQLYPFRGDLMKKILARYQNAEAYVWTQEEPQNQGAWTSVRHEIEDAAPKAIRLKYSGRKASPSTATGSYRIHAQEQKDLIKRSFEI